MKIRSKWIYFGALASALTVGALAHAGKHHGHYKRDGGHGAIKFHAKGPAGLNIDGKAALVVAQQEGSNLVFKADLNSVKTGIDMRDGHCKKALNVKKSQFAELIVPVESINPPEPGKKSSGTATGTFKLNGKSKPVKFSYQAKSAGPKYAVQGKFSINYTDFGIEKQCYLKQCVDPKVDVVARVKLKAE
jgi:polyisoprenoid-binding protein YceI